MYVEEASSGPHTHQTIHRHAEEFLWREAAECSWTPTESAIAEEQSV